jgi:hypothetical protein
VLEVVREPFGLVGAEPDDSTRLPPWLLERVAHVPHHRLSRRLPSALERPPPLPGRFQARGCVLRARHKSWITHSAISSSPSKFRRPGQTRTGRPARIRTGPSAASACYPGRCALPREPNSRDLREPRPCEPRPPTGTDPPIRRTSSAVSMPQVTWRNTAVSRPHSRGGMLLGTLLRNTGEQSTNFGLPVAPVPPQRANRRKLAGLRPACHRLGVDTEHRGDLRRRQQGLSLWSTCGH